MRSADARTTLWSVKKCCLTKTLDCLRGPVRLTLLHIYYAAF